MGPHALAELIPAWPQQTHLELGAFPSAVPCARAHVRAVATECGLAHLANAAELLASEIVTNAVQASDQLKIADTPVVRITVTTDREFPPHPRMGRQRRHACTSASPTH
jgi:hypothetical protein